MAKPLLFITGFLGAGKTTLLRGLLAEFARLDRTGDVILNDFENAEIDASTLPETRAAIFPLAASCACCDSLEDLVKLCRAAQNSEGDVLLIELNGTADPLPLLETFTLLEEKIPFSPRWQVGVVDARHWGRRGDFDALERRQIETATHWILTHREGLLPDEEEAIASSIVAVNRHAVRIEVGLLAAELDASIGSIGSIGSPGVSETPPRKSGCDSTHDHEHALSHRFTGCQIPLPGQYRREQIVRFLECLPAEVVRAKALVKLSEAPGSRWLFERTGQHPVDGPQEVEGLTRASSSLVCIGPGLDPAALRGIVAEHFGV